MSREFGSCINGYFHAQIETAAKDCLDGDDELTRLWGEFFLEFSPIAYAISSSEAKDNYVAYPINECRKRMPGLKDKLNAIERYLEPFEHVAASAVEKYIREQKGG